jgi:hypothetical protein
VTIIDGHRVCACGCGADLSGFDARRQYLNKAHKQRRYDQEGGIRAPLDSDAPPDPDSPPDIAITKARQAVIELAIKEVQLTDAQLDIDKKRGELVPFDEVAGEFAARAIAVRTKLLGVPTRFKQRWQACTMEQIDDLEALLREALEELVREESAVADDSEST